MRWVSQLADLTADIPAPRGTSATQELPESRGWFVFGKTRLIESSLAGLFIPAFRDGAHCRSSVTGAEAAAYFLSVPPLRDAGVERAFTCLARSSWSMFGRLACSLKKDLLRRKRHFFAAQPTKRRRRLISELRELIIDVGALRNLWDPPDEREARTEGQAKITLIQSR